MDEGVSQLVDAYTGLMLCLGCCANIGDDTEAWEFKGNQEQARRYRKLTANDQNTCLSMLVCYCSLAGLSGKLIKSEDQYRPMHASGPDSCTSKYMQHCFWKSTRKPPSSQFLSALREYEALHQRCVQGQNLTETFITGTAPEGCQYLVWKELDGKGNQLVSLVSAFVYSLLTHRILLITPQESLNLLLCEPFPRSSWQVPSGFPYDAMQSKGGSQGDFFQRAQNLTGRGSESLLDTDFKNIPRHLFVSLSNISPPPHHDRRFFCPAEQKLLGRIPWLLFRSNQYMIPGLYFLPEFRKALNHLFPDREVFLHAGRYLLNPSNDIWGRITKFYDGYLAGADKRVGIQVRSWTPEYKPVISDHILKCAVDTNILPNLTRKATAIPTHNSYKKITILMTALTVQYHLDLREHYMRHENVGGESQ
uniref:Fucosyltransferase n=2 Tax=Physcomitrium patens TaxID=3218 RepID=A0A2K1KFJ3_PHYPA|nr:hypothetical protein PHYPA_008907 [Physcomitrium patens]